MELNAMDLRASALRYAAHGWPVFPLHSIRDAACTCGKTDCESPGKHPRTRHGLNDASADAARIEGWWSRWPDANVGILTGARAGIVVIDIDPRNGGDGSLVELEAEYGELPETIEALTGGAGRHLFFAHPGGKLAGKARPGIDVKADGGYVVAAPSNHVSGGRYRWREGRGPHELKPAPLPDWLRLLLTPNWQPKATPPAAGNRPGDDFNRREDVGELLTKHDWRRCRDGDNEHWTRPGKSGGTSATLKDRVFYVFSTNAPPFEANRAYSPFAVYALLECGGDHARAARELSAHGFGDGRATGNKTTGRGAAATGAPVLVKLSDVQPEPVCWLWPDRIALGKLTLIAGDPGLGKSLLTLDMAARVSRGTPWPDAPLSPAPMGGVVLLSAEDDLADTIRPRLDAARADASKIAFLQAVRTPDPETGGTRSAPFMLSGDLPALERAIETTPDCKLVIIDPISAYLGGGVRFDSHRNSDVRAVLAPLAELAAWRGVAVVAVTHLRKAEGPSMYRAMGSLAFVAAARAVWAVGHDKDAPARRLFLPVKCNLAGELTGLAFALRDSGGGVPCVAWEPGPIDTSADEALATPFTGTRGPEPEQQNRAAGWLRRALADGPRPAKELIEEGREGEGLAKRTIDRARQSLGIAAYRPEVPGPWYWRLPGQGCHDTPRAPEQKQLGNLGNLAESAQKRGFSGSPDPEISKDAKLPVLGNLGLESASDATPGCPDGELPLDDCLENTAAAEAEGDGWGDL